MFHVYIYVYIRYSGRKSTAKSLAKSPFFFKKNGAGGGIEPSNVQLLTEILHQIVVLTPRYSLTAQLPREVASITTPSLSVVHTLRRAYNSGLNFSIRASVLGCGQWTSPHPPEGVTHAAWALRRDSICRCFCCWRLVRGEGSGVPVAAAEDAAAPLPPLESGKSQFMILPTDPG